MASANSFAQYVTEAPQGGFDFTQGTDYVVLYAPSDAVEKMGSQLLSNQNLDPEQEKNSFQYWVTDWDKTLLTLYNVEEEGKTNSFGTSEYMNMTPLFAWGSGQFHAFKESGFSYDLSMLDDDYVMHLGLRDFGNAPCQLNIQLLPEQKLSYKLRVNLAVGEGKGEYVGVGNIGHDGNWYYLDIPLRDLNDEEGDFGFEPDFTKTGDNVFVIGFEEPTCSKYTTGATDPISGLKEINITELQSAASFDALFFYKPNTDGIEETTVSQNGAAQYFDILGRKVSSNAHGVTIVKTANGVKKIVK